LVPVFFNWLMFWALYQWVPTITVSRKASLLGGLIAGVAWVLLNNAFTWYLSSGLTQYQLVYGSLGTIVALLFWVYLTATIVLIGAHLTATIQRKNQKRPDGWEQ
jgi:membrane protein